MPQVSRRWEGKTRAELETLLLCDPIVRPWGRDEGRLLLRSKLTAKIVLLRG